MGLLNPQYKPVYSPEAILEIVNATKQAIAVTRFSVGESRRLARQTRRQLSETHQRLQDSMVFISGKDESFRKLAGFLSGGEGWCSQLSSHNQQL